MGGEGGVGMRGKESPGGDIPLTDCAVRCFSAQSGGYTCATEPDTARKQTLVRRRALQQTYGGSGTCLCDRGTKTLRTATAVRRRSYV